MDPIDLLVFGRTTTDLASGRHLLAVAHNDGCTCATERSDCFGHGDLGCLVEDDEVKLHDAGLDQVDHG